MKIVNFKLNGNKILKLLMTFSIWLLFIITSDEQYVKHIHNYQSARSLPYTCQKLCKILIFKLEFK